MYVAFLVAGMVITGSTNSIFTKYQASPPTPPAIADLADLADPPQDMQCVENCDSAPIVFEQPVWQTLQMFVGEMLCFLPVVYGLLAALRKSPLRLTTNDPDDPHAKLQALTGPRVLLLWIPAACDLTGTTLMNVGLLYTPVSIYQMTRGALVLFVGMLSVIFLRRRLWLYQWFALVAVMAGVSVVGLSGSMIKKDAPHQASASADTPEATTVLVGVFFVLFAQIFTAIQFVVEEKIMSRYSVAPLVAVGYEGFFGFLTIIIFLPLLAHYADRSPFFDLPRGWSHIVHTPSVLWSSIAIALSIALFNGFGLSVTRHLSATARSVIDCCRTLAIWIVSLGLGWEKLLFPVSFLQVAGFAMLVYGTFLFNNLVNPPVCLGPAPVGERQPEGENMDANEEERALLRDETLDETAALPADLGSSGYDVIPTQSHPAPARS